jgi:hypothetical protein
VGQWLHGIALVAGTLSICFFNLAIEVHRMNDLNGAIFFGYLSIHLITLPFFAELDAYSRFQNYKLTKDLIYRYGFQIRFIKSLRHSKCQREAAFYAARDLGCKNELIHYFKGCGYRWYHIFPDFIWTHPEYLFSKHFWSTTFFVKTYHPRYYGN